MKGPLVELPNKAEDSCVFGFTLCRVTTIRQVFSLCMLVEHVRLRLTVAQVRVRSEGTSMRQVQRQVLISCLGSAWCHA